jgi:hypothetical protein
MTHALDAVVAKLSALPAEEQDRIAKWLADELAAEDGWARRFGTSRDVLRSLADEALADEAAGRTTDVDPDRM